MDQLPTLGQIETLLNERRFRALKQMGLDIIYANGSVFNRSDATTAVLAIAEGLKAQEIKGEGGRSLPVPDESDQAKFGFGTDQVIAANAVEAAARYGSPAEIRGGVDLIIQHPKYFMLPMQTLIAVENALLRRNAEDGKNQKVELLKYIGDSWWREKNNPSRLTDDRYNEAKEMGRHASPAGVLFHHAIDVMLAWAEKSNSFDPLYRAVRTVKAAQKDGVKIPEGKLRDGTFVLLDLHKERALDSIYNSAQNFPEAGERAKALSFFIDNSKAHDARRPDAEKLLESTNAVLTLEREEAHRRTTLRWRIRTSPLGRFTGALLGTPFRRATTAAVITALSAWQWGSAAKEFFIKKPPLPSRLEVQAPSQPAAIQTAYQPRGPGF